MQLYDWLMLTSIACIIVMTISAIYLLSRLRQRIEIQTQQIKESTNKMRAIPTEVQHEVKTKLLDVQHKIQLGWKIFSFIRHRRLKRKLKKARS